jgi:hypothetical protein
VTRCCGARLTWSRRRHARLRCRAPPGRTPRRGAHAPATSSAPPNDVAGERSETWIPVDHREQTKQRGLYPPLPSGTPVGQVVAGVGLYLLVFALLGMVTVPNGRTEAVTVRT